VASAEKGSDDQYHVSNITIYVKTAVGKRPIDMRNETLTVAYFDPYVHIDRLLRSDDASKTEVTVTEVSGDGDNLPEFGEIWKIVVSVKNIYGGSIR